MNGFRWSRWGRALGAACALVLAAPPMARASSHAEAPLISQDPSVDNADV